MLSLGRQSDHELGFTVPDKVYFAETRQYVEIPDFLLSPAFLRAVSRNETLKRAKAMLRELNVTRAADDKLLFFSYQSRHLGTPDNPDSFWRLLIVVPGNPAQNIPEKWVQFGVPDPRARAPVRNVSVVAVVPAADGTSNVYFQDYFRSFSTVLYSSPAIRDLTSIWMPPNLVPVWAQPVWPTPLVQEYIPSQQPEVME